ncbi:MAG TPA: 6-phosphogluconolactonase [Pyrinomonadaceae bacterium]|nr:6-phosphogluconolactonase [Pyrinomonadaceae bacterium]
MLNTSTKVSVFDTPEQVAVAAAECFVESADELRRGLARFSVGLAGGNTPRRVYELLATDQFRNQVEWPRVYLFFGDERCVPAEHPDSNYRMAFESLISQVPIPAANVQRIIGEGNANENARAYENELRAFFAGLSYPRLDLVLLGMGDDGHTASLFPDSPALQESSRWVVPTRNEQSGQDRITLTIPVFNHARHVAFLVTGKKKAQRLKEVLRPEPESKELPVQAIAPIEGMLEWLVDREAAALL